MDRNTFQAAVKKFKEFIKELTELQKRDKRIIRMSRKTAEQCAAVQAEVDRYYPSVYERDVGWVQSIVATRKEKITAVLNYYLMFKGKKPNHNTARYGLGYEKYTRNRVRKEIEERCCITLDAHSHQLTTGKTT